MINSLIKICRRCAIIKQKQGKKVRQIGHLIHGASSVVNGLRRLAGHGTAVPAGLDKEIKALEYDLEDLAESMQVMWLNKPLATP